MTSEKQQVGTEAGLNDLVAALERLYRHHLIDKVLFVCPDCGGPEPCNCTQHEGRKP